MRMIDDFIVDKDVDIVENRIDEKMLNDLFADISFVPGKQFIEFAKRYSYFAYGDIEFFGINDELKEKSNLFLNTKILIENYEQLKGYYIVESCGDGFYVLIDADDNVYHFFVGDSSKPEPLGIKFYDYVLKRLKEAEL